MTPKEVFLSHSSKDRKTASAVVETLRNHGVPVWYSPTAIMTAEVWQDQIGRALRRCDWFMVLVSDNAIGSKWVKLELGYALNHGQYDGHILPVTIEDCDYESLSWTLGVFQMADMSSDPEEAWRQILQAWGLGFDPAKMVRP